MLQPIKKQSSNGRRTAAAKKIINSFKILKNKHTHTLFHLRHVSCDNLARTLCSAARLRLLKVSSRTATIVPSPRPRESTRNIPLRLCGCTADTLPLSAMQLLAHHLLRK